MALVVIGVGATLTAAGSASSGGTAVAARITVTFTDTNLAVTPPRLEAGTATVVVVNKGRTSHGLAIVGPGLKNARTAKLLAGKTAKLTVKLSTGAYELADTVGKAKVRWLVVTPATVVSSSGNGSVVVPLTDPTRMDCD
jgi:hypothetical protein